VSVKVRAAEAIFNHAAKGQLPRSDDSVSLAFFACDPLNKEQGPPIRF
jgi:hypothetical protein